MKTKKKLSGKAKIILIANTICLIIWQLTTFFSAWGMSDAGVVNYDFFYPWIEDAKLGSWFSIFYITYSVILGLQLAVSIPLILYAILIKFSLGIKKKALGWMIIISIIMFLLLVISEFFGTGYAPDRAINITDVSVEPVKLYEKIEERDKDANSLEGCPVLFELGKWEMNENTLAISRESILYKTGSYYKKEINLYSGNPSIGRNPSYIGPWYSVTIPSIPSHSEEFEGVDEALYNNAKLWSKERDEMNEKISKNRKRLQQKIVRENIQEVKQVRFLANKRDDDLLDLLYELQTEENKIVPEKKFNLFSDRHPLDLCFARWNAKFGINAVADCKRTWWRFFTKDALRCTGSIIDVKTKEIIAKGITDNTGKIIGAR